MHLLGGITFRRALSHTNHLVRSSFALWFGQHLLQTKIWDQQLTPCLQACSFRALTQVLCQCPLKDLKENRDVSKPFTPASDAGPPSLPQRSFSRKPNTPPGWQWWGCVKDGCCQAGSLPSCSAVFLAFRSRSRFSKYWSSHPSTMSKETRKRPTRHSQPNCRSSITVSRSLSYHQVRSKISGLSVRADLLPLPVRSSTQRQSP